MGTCDKRSALCTRLTLKPGLKSVNVIDDWIKIDETYMSRLEYKRTLYAQHYDDVVQAQPGSLEPSFEALYALTDFLPRRYPTMFKKMKDGIHNLTTDEIWDLRRESIVWETHHPLQVMGLLTTEDWFIMQTDEDGETTRLRAGAVCFPGKHSNRLTNLNATDKCL